jgi:hypothetical protein
VSERHSGPIRVRYTCLFGGDFLIIGVMFTYDFVTRGRLNRALVQTEQKSLL